MGALGLVKPNFGEGLKCLEQKDIVPSINFVKEDNQSTAWLDSTQAEN